MEYNLIKQAIPHVRDIISVPAKQELKPSKNGAAQELEKALEDTKVCNAFLNELEAVLRRCFLLVGLRAANMPSPEETQILTPFIYKKYSGLTLAEIQLAFEKAVAGELECEATCYENFSCAYFGQIMSAYKKWAAQKFNENQMYLVKPQTETLLTMPADWKELCEMYYQDYLNNKFVFSVMPWQLYDEFVKLGWMEVDAFEDWEGVAIRNIRMRLNAEKTEALSAQQLREVDILRNQIDSLTTESDHVKFEAKKLAVQFLFKTAKEKGFKNLFVKS